MILLFFLLQNQDRFRHIHNLSIGRFQRFQFRQRRFRQTVDGVLGRIQRWHCFFQHFIAFSFNAIGTIQHHLRFRFLFHRDCFLRIHFYSLFATFLNQRVGGNLFLLHNLQFFNEVFFQRRHIFGGLLQCRNTFIQSLNLFVQSIRLLLEQLLVEINQFQKRLRRRIIVAFLHLIIFARHGVDRDMIVRHMMRNLIALFVAQNLGQLFRFAQETIRDRGQRIIRPRKEPIE
mmetsp:Transcript_45115/g.74784  ORF Transcript_45115/g.74784 Transcript_45115/m.74784 type:complete len:231 (+) Transcript_45115:414-1106(+)